MKKQTRQTLATFAVYFSMSTLVIGLGFALPAAAQRRIKPKTIIIPQSSPPRPKEPKSWLLTVNLVVKGAGQHKDEIYGRVYSWNINRSYTGHFLLNYSQPVARMDDDPARMTQAQLMALVKNPPVMWFDYEATTGAKPQKLCVKIHDKLVFQNSLSATTTTWDGEGYVLADPGQNVVFDKYRSTYNVRIPMRLREADSLLMVIYETGGKRTTRDLALWTFPIPGQGNQGWVHPTPLPLVKDLSHNSGPVPLPGPSLPEIAESGKGVTYQFSYDLRANVLPGRTGCD